MKKIYVITGILTTLLLASLTSLAQTQSRADIRKEIENKRVELAALEKAYLEPGEEDRTRYAEILREPNTGLVRVLPREKFDLEGTTGAKSGMTLRGGGAFYSFTRLTHEYGYGTSISLTQGNLETGFAGLDYGMLVDLGDIPLESVGPATRAVGAFSAHKPPKNEPQIRQEQRRFQVGTTVDEVPAKDSLPLKLNSTYLLRAISYRDSDVLVAFKVVRIDPADDSAIILWKLLQTFPKPEYVLAEPVVGR